MSKDNLLVEGLEESIEHHDQPSGFINPDATMLFLTWITFFLLLAVLYKYAWKPILAALDHREKHIEDAVKNADQIKKELEEIDAKCRNLIAEAEEKSKALIERSKKAAHEAAKHIEQKAREESQILIENAQREIKNEVEKARANLRAESADIIVKLASKIIEENLDEEKNKKLINQYIREI
ncbi:MAG: F0F1 ATP synthase subunit B [Candidatus Omnitrophica bacterium]|nr:F0F1 ATP synthase subunit B [Candidatus Omnitrophota bacterium]